MKLFVVLKTVKNIEYNVGHEQRRKTMGKIVCLDPRAKFNAYGWFKLPLLGLLYVATVWKQLGHEVEVISEVFGDVYDALRHELSPQFIEKLRGAKVLAISVMTATAVRAYAIADAARKVCPHLWIIMGGPHVSFQEEEALQHCNAVVKGEGESVDVLERALGSSGVIKAPSLIENLNDLPFPDFDRIEGYGPWLSGRNRRWRRRWVPILTSRGCPQACSFCSVTKMYGRKYRCRDPKNVLEEMEERIARGYAPNFFLCDDNLGANPERLKKWAELIHTRIINELGCRNLRIVGEARVEIAKDEELLRLLHLAKVKCIFIGVESVSPQTLAEFNKRQTVEDIRYCVSRLRAHGIQAQGMFVVGGKNDTPSTLKQTVAFARETGMNTIQISILIPLPGTKMYEMLESQGRIFTKDWSLYDGTVVVFFHPQMTMRQLQQAFLRAWQRFYLWKAMRNPLYLVATIVGTQLWERIHGQAFRELARQFEG